MKISSIAPSLPVTSAASSSSSRAPSSTPTVDYNQFLRLLVAELRNQDPTSPTDPTQYMSQLASFSTVEQQVQTNSTLDALLSAQATNIIGKTVTSADGRTSGIVVSVQISSRGGAIAKLTDGSTVTLGTGVTVAASCMRPTHWSCSTQRSGRSSSAPVQRWQLRCSSVSSSPSSGH